MKEVRKQRILVFIDWYLPGYKAGGPVRSMANLTEHLAGDFEFYIVTRNSEYGEEQPYDSVESDRWTPFAKDVFVWYCSKATPSITLWRKLFKESGCDIIYINGVYSFLFSVLPLLAARFHGFSRVIVAPRGMLANSAINVKKGKKKFFLWLVKQLGFYKNVQWHVTNDAEGCQVNAVVGSEAKIFIANNLPRKVAMQFERVEKSPGTLRLCSLARIAPEKNTLYAIECLQKLPKDINVELDLYGQIYNQGYWTDCQSANSKLPENIQVIYKSFVEAEKIPDTLRLYHALFLPTRGENFGHVILESFMSGRPVIISDQTPWKGLKELQTGWDLPLINMSKFTEVITKLAMMEQEEYDDWCRGAWEMGLKEANDVKLVERYRSLFENNRKCVE